MIAIAVILVVGPALATTAWAMRDPTFGSVEHKYLGWILTGKTENTNQRDAKTFMSSTEAISADLDARHLRSGALVVDTFSNCMWAIVVVSKHPHQFVITSDRDFERVVADPPTFKAQYLMVPPTDLTGGLDALNRNYPKLYDSGAGFAKMVKEYHEPACPAFRLYRITRSPRSVGRP